MNRFAVQSVEIAAPPQRVFEFVADANELPRWTDAFAEVGDGRALMRTPNGEVDVGLKVNSSAQHGTVDWYMTFPDGTVADAYSRIVPLGEDRSIYCFVLTPPPVPMEQLEGTLDEQSRTLAKELSNLKALLENRK